METNQYPPFLRVAGNPVFFFALLLLSHLLSAQDYKNKIPKYQLPVIELNACDIEDRVVSIILRSTSIKELSYNTNMYTIDFGFYIKKKGVEQHLRFANNRSLIVNNQYAELNEAKLRVQILKTDLPNPDRLGYSYDIDSKDLKDGAYQISMLDLFKKLIFGINFANGETPVHLIAYPNNKSSDPLELKITAQKEPLSSSDMPFLLIPAGKKIPVSNYFLYIDIDECMDHDLLINAIRDSIDAVRKADGSYYLYLSNPSSEAYTASSSGKDGESEPYESILNEIRRIEPGRAQIDKDINNLGEVISNILQQAKSRKSKPEELRFVFLLPGTSVEHKKKWLNKMNDLTKDKGFKITPYFYDCTMQPLN